MTRSSTLTPEDSIQAYLPSLQRFKSYMRDFPAQPRNLKLVKCETLVGPEAIILLTPTVVVSRVSQNGGTRNSAVAFGRQSPCANLMAEYVTVATTDELQRGDRIVVEIDGHYVAVFNVDNHYYAIEDVCTHDDGPLAEGELTGTVIECPRHGAQFDITNGAVLRFPAITPVPWYPTRVEGNEIQVLI